MLIYRRESKAEVCGFYINSQKIIIQRLGLLDLSKSI